MNIIRRCLLTAVAASAACGCSSASAQYTLTTLVSNTNGSAASNGLLADAGGNLYGTTYYGGANNDGTVFEVASGTHLLSTLVTFNGANGQIPKAGLIADGDGNLYGTTSGGGAHGLGTVFEVAAGTHMLTTLATFNGSNGSYPRCVLVADASGNLFGTTQNGGALDSGTVFEVASGTHALSTLATFNGVNGAGPQAGLIADGGGNLYGTTLLGGTGGTGTVFKVTAGTHAIITLASFNGSNGSDPGCGLLADAGGNLYGVTQRGGANNDGTVFEVASGTHLLSTLVTFNGANGQSPAWGLIADGGGNLYGTTGLGGDLSVNNGNGGGTVFEVAAGTHLLNTLATFSGATGEFPGSSLIADASGNLYGTTFSPGTVFELSPAGAWTGAINANWADSGNWSGPVPGATTGTTSTASAYFNQNAPSSPLAIDADRNVRSITFDTASVNSLTIGTITGNALLLTAGGIIQTTSTVVSPQTVNAPLVLEGDYTFTSGATSNSATFSFGGGITPGATSGITTLTLNGTNTGANTISGVLADNGAGRLAVTKSGPGLWILSGANTNSGDIAVTGGTLRLNITSGTPTIAAAITATVASGATLELAGSVSALGTAGGNRAHVSNSSSAPGVLVSGTNQVVGAIDGTGNVQVNAGSDLTADHIIQNALVIGGSDGSPALVMIAASDSSGNPLGEPSTLALAGSLTPSNPFGDSVNSVNLLDGPAISDSGSAAVSPSSSPGGVGSSAVPEPSTIALFAIALAGLFINSHRSHRRDNLARFFR